MNILTASDFQKGDSFSQINKNKKIIMAYLRNNGLVSEWEYKGKTLEEATEYAKQGGFEVRVVEVDGQAKMLDMSVSSARVNFRVKNGIVTTVYTG